MNPFPWPLKAHACRWTMAKSAFAGMIKVNY